MNNRFALDHDGIFDVGVNAKTFAELSGAVYGQAMGAENMSWTAMDYNFKVLVDGKYYGSFNVRADDPEAYKKGYLALRLSEGAHDLKLIWDLPRVYQNQEMFGHLNIQVKDVFISDHRVT